MARLGRRVAERATARLQRADRMRDRRVQSRPRASSRARAGASLRAWARTVASFAACCLASTFALHAPRSAAASNARSAPCDEGAVFVAAGTAWVGTSSFAGFDTNEQPRRTFTLSQGYCLDRTEVTVDAYRRCVVAGACEAATPAFVGASLPMTNVRWLDARRFCAWTGGRLPTEVEWEHAARGGDDRLYPWGDGQADCRRADVWTDGDGACNGYGPSPVGSFPAGAAPSGALDMAGNVLEWVDDAYLDDAWRSLDERDPHFDDPTAARHVVRGGSWQYDVVHSARVSDRDGYPSGLRDEALGFRCAHSPRPSSSTATGSSPAPKVASSVRR
jgi:formylglycine-generating enzyme required for sulfatase activity